MCSRLFSTARSFLKLAAYYKQTKDIKSAFLSLKKAQTIAPKNSEVALALENFNIRP